MLRRTDRPRRRVRSSVDGVWTSRAVAAVRNTAQAFAPTWSRLPWVCTWEWNRRVCGERWTLRRPAPLCAQRLRPLSLRSAGREGFRFSASRQHTRAVHCCQAPGWEVASNCDSDLVALAAGDVALSFGKTSVQGVGRAGGWGLDLKNCASAQRRCAASLTLRPSRGLALWWLCLQACPSKSRLLKHLERSLDLHRADGCVRGRGAPRRRSRCGGVLSCTSAPPPPPVLHSNEFCILLAGHALGFYLLTYLFIFASTWLLWASSQRVAASLYPGVCVRKWHVVSITLRLKHL